MREEPKDAGISKEAWDRFEYLADDKGVGDHPDDWLIWFIFFLAGYEAGLEE